MSGVGIRRETDGAKRRVLGGPVALGRPPPGEGEGGELLRIKISLEYHLSWSTLSR